MEHTRIMLTAEVSEAMLFFSKKKLKYYLFSLEELDDSLLEMVQEASHLFTNSTLFSEQCPYKLICTSVHSTNRGINQMLDIGQLVGMY